jgi:hypothetical protein
VGYGEAPTFAIPLAPSQGSIVCAKRPRDMGLEPVGDRLGLWN